MINTLQNSPERVPSKWGNKFKKAVALAIALTLSGEPAEAKTYEKQEFPTEMLANIPWEYAPMTENIEQATVPNYINQAQNWVKKYYPEFKVYFEEIFTKINWLNSTTKKIINEKIQEYLDIFSDEISSEKEKQTIILIVLELISWKDELEKSETLWIENETKEISKEISKAIKIQLRKEINDTKNRTENITIKNNKLKEILNYLNSWKTDKKTTEIITQKIEELFSLYNKEEIKGNEWLQKIIKQYIELNKQINRRPSDIGKKFIEEYNKTKR